MNIKQILEEQKEEFEKFKKVWNSKHSEFIRIPDGIKGNIFNWHKQSLIDLLQGLVEELRGKKKNLCTHLYSQEDGYCHICFDILLNQSPEDSSYNQLIDNQITHLLSVIEEVKSL